MRRFFRLFWASALGLLPLGAAEARERLVMPFECGIERGEVHLSPSGEMSYPIIGARDEQTVTTCPPGSASVCRTVMVHQFSIACGSKTVAWMRVAAAIRSAAANRAWIEDGRLNLVMPARGSQEASPAHCLNQGGSQLQRQVVLSGNCLPWPRKASFDHLVLPPGYAPLGELGARLMIGAAADEAATTPDDTAPLALTPVALSDSDLDVIAKADPDAVLEPAGRPETFETALEPEAANDDWITVVRAGPDEVPVPTSATEPKSSGWAWIAALGAAAFIVLMLVARYSSMLRARLVGLSTFRLAHSNMTLANASNAVSALLLQTESTTRDLKGAGPLREVLLGELALVRERLVNTNRLTAKGELSVEKSAPQYRAMIRELERIRRIVDSALASLSGVKQATALPRTTSEAYEVLGVNAEVSDGVLKKIVDALRMSWHPDHARDEGDRALREDRIRQINIAWDLINGKREAA